MAILAEGELRKWYNLLTLDNLIKKHLDDKTNGKNLLRICGPHFWETSHSS